MYTAKISFEIDKKTDFEKAWDVINSLLGDWRWNGQMLGEQFLTAKTKKGIEAFVNIPEKNSLSKKYNGKYVKQRLAELSEINVKSPKINVIGKEEDSTLLCNCESQTSYILFTTYISVSSPLRCFKCFGGIPLYYIPKINDNSYSNVISWQRNYQSCDSLQMGGTIGERFGINQLSKYDSTLSKEGLEVCRSIEKATNKKVFYYLYKYTAKSHKAELARKCPNCNGEWHRKKALHNLFDFECKKCKLLSNIASDLRY